MVFELRGAIFPITELMLDSAAHDGPIGPQAAAPARAAKDCPVKRRREIFAMMIYFPVMLFLVRQKSYQEPVSRQLRPILLIYRRGESGVQPFLRTVRLLNSGGGESARRPFTGISRPL